MINVFHSRLQINLSLYLDKILMIRQRAFGDFRNELDKLSSHGYAKLEMSICGTLVSLE